MTAICGWLWPPEDIRQRNCRNALRLLAPYGAGAPRVRSFESASFGTDLRHLLPEDRFDQQPLQVGPYLLVADLRVDNRDDLARSLNLDGASMGRMSDAELLAAAWRKWEADAFSQVIGDYAVAVYSSVDEALWLARSIGGNRPLFYHQDQASRTAFSSMASALWCDPSMRRGLEMQRLAQGLAGLLPDDDERSYLLGINRVLPGQVLRLDRNGRKQSSFAWEPRYRRLTLSSQDEYVEAFRAVLDAAIKPRLRTRSATVAAQLSAGFDSNAVTGTAAKYINGQHLIALTATPRLGYDGPTHSGKLADESAAAELTTRMHGIDHIVVHGAGDPLADVEATTALYEDPFRNVLNASWDCQLRSAAVARGAEVLLTGELGNLTLTAGGTYVLGDLIADHAWRAWLRQAWSARSEVSRRAILANSFERWTPGWIMSALERLLYQTPRWWELTFLRGEWRSRVRESGRSGQRRRNSYEERWDAIRVFDSGTVRKGSLAETPIDTRDPLIDRRIIDFSLSLPPEQLFSYGQASPLATRALSDRVPADILKRRIRGHQSADWHERMRPEKLRALAEEIAGVPAADELIDFSELRRAIDAWPSTDLGSSRTVSRYSIYLPMTVAAGLYLREFERRRREISSD